MLSFLFYFAFFRHYSSHFVNFCIYGLIYGLNSSRDLILQHPIDVIHYVMVDVAGNEKPVVNLSLILNMVEWFYAVRIFQETGLTYRLAAMLAPFEEFPAGLQGEARCPYKQVEGLRKTFEMVAAAYVQALPLGFGTWSAGLLDKLKDTVLSA